MRWAIENVNEFVDTYCVHFYCFNDAEPGDLSNYDYVHTNLAKAVELAYRREKRCSLGEFGYIGGPALSRPGAMRHHVCGWLGDDRSHQLGRAEDGEDRLRLPSDDEKVARLPL